MWEDSSANRLDDSLDLFKQIINSDTFLDKDIVLFLNKKDIFKEKTKKVTILQNINTLTDRVSNLFFFSILVTNPNREAKKLLFKKKSCQRNG